MDLRVFTEPQQGASYGDLLRVARVAEDAGYDAFFRSDHYLVMGDGDGQPGPTDAWVTLAGLARDTSRIRLGTLVTAATLRSRRTPSPGNQTPLRPSTRSAVRPRSAHTSMSACSRARTYATTSTGSRRRTIG